MLGCPGVLAVGPVSQVIFPFHGKQVFLAIVAGLAGRHHVASGGSPSSNQRHNVVHRQLFGERLAAAVMAGSSGYLPLPPLGLAQVFRLFFLTSDLLWRNAHQKDGIAID